MFRTNVMSVVLRRFAPGGRTGSPLRAATPVVSGALLLLCALRPAAQMLTLAEAEHKTVTTGYTARISHFEEQKTLWEKRNVVSGYLPSATYALTWLHMDPATVERANFATDIFSGFPGVDPGDIPRNAYRSSFSHEIKLNQPVFNGGAELVAIGMAGRTTRLRAFQTQEERQRAVYETRTSYFDALVAHETLALAQHSLAWTRLNLSRTRVRAESGELPPTDLLRWEAEIATREAGEAGAKAARDLQFAALANAMGVPLSRADTSWTLEPLEEFEAWYRAGPANLSGDVHDNLQIKAIGAATELAHGSRRLAVAAFLPKVNGFVSWSWPAWESLGPNTEESGWTAGVSAAVPLTSGGRNLTGYHTSRYAHYVAQVTEERARNGIAINLERIRRMYAAARIKTEATARSHELLQRQLDMMQSRYVAGMVNQVQLLEIHLAQHRSRLDYVQALLESLALESEFLLTTGSLEVFNGHD